MPEGDSVWRVARRLHHAFVGSALVRSDLRWPSLATADLRGATTLEVVSRGKHILHRFDNGMTLHSHLRKDGSWRMSATTSPPSPYAAHSVRAVLSTVQWTAVGNALGMLDVVRTREERRFVGQLGPDPLGPDWNPAEAARRISASPDTLGAALLDQNNLAGLGTVWTAESLFAQGLNPWRPASTVPFPDLVALADRAHQLLNASIRERRSSRRPPTAYRQLHQPCTRCGTSIEAGTVGAGPLARTLIYCPCCQR